MTRLQSRFVRNIYITDPMLIGFEFSLAKKTARNRVKNRNGCETINLNKANPLSIVTANVEPNW